MTGPWSTRHDPLTGPEVVGVVRWDELLHDWQTRSEHDGGYSLLCCRVCGTEVVR